MCNKINYAIQYTVDLINNNINRDVQEECANSFMFLMLIKVAFIWSIIQKETVIFWNIIAI